MGSEMCIRDRADAAQQRPCQLATAAMEPIGETLLETLFEFLHGGSTDARRPDWPTACARQAAARWRFRGRTMTAGPLDGRVAACAVGGWAAPSVVTLVEH